ncbi:MAG: IS200/IS605 family transposase [Paludibacteraceae bacterium]|nr:IS200/IS605 family transposase [Paludibacteraceae bacterium]
MAQSLSKIYLHIIFHIKSRSSYIRPEDLERLHSYIGQLVNATGCLNMWTNGTEDHVHILCEMSREVTISHLIQEVKRNSSRWIKTLHTHYNTFAWQSGYAIFSVGQNGVEPTLEYIKNQQEHHRKRTFREEYLAFLQLYHVDYNEDYVLSD